MNSWSNVQKNALDFISEKGLPTRHHEDWKYTSLKPLGDITLVPKMAQTDEEIDVHPSVEKWFEENESGLSSDSSTFPIIFIDGILVQWPEFAEMRIVPTDIALSNKITSAKIIYKISKIRKKIKNFRQDSIEALNTAFTHSGALIVVDENVAFDRPVEIIHLISDHKSPLIAKNWLFLGKNSKVELIERFVILNNQETETNYSNIVSEFVLDENSSLNYNLIQKHARQLNLTRVYSGKNSSFVSNVCLADSSLSRHQLDVYLTETGASAKLYGTSIASGKNHIDHCTLISHVVGDCTSEQLYKNILADQSRVVFNGKVYIGHDSQKASSEQLNNNLLLSSQAEADSRPQLEIYADDVKATHGSTIGQLEDDELFYIQSRGISKIRAQELLCAGFALEIADKIETPLVKNLFVSEINDSIQKIVSQL